MADRQEPTISRTGVWVDTETGHVVESEPEQGKLLVPPGGEIDQRVRDDIAAAKLVSGQVDAPEVDEDNDGDQKADQSVEQADDKPRRGRNVQKATDADKAEKATE
jgi:hypothetical protein